MKSKVEMASYSVKKLAKLSGVSVRTLHYYDQIGLLEPYVRTEAGYRLYGKKELLRLQQILFYKELDLPLKDIREILESDAFDLIDALEAHKVSLRAKKDRMAILLVTIDNTIQHLKKDIVMERPEELYKGLNAETARKHRKEAIKKYGKKTIEHSEKELMKLGKAGFEKLKEEARRNTAVLYSMRLEGPTSEFVQAEIARHYRIIRQYWGKANDPDKQAEAYAGLGKLYVSDERYTMVEGKPQPEFADFMCKAMAYFAKNELS